MNERENGKYESGGADSNADCPKTIHLKGGFSDRQTAFLKAFSLSGNISRAAKAAHVSRRNVPRWKRCPKFRAAFDAALRESVNRLIDAAMERSIEGVGRIVFRNGRPFIDPETGDPYMEYDYSDGVLIFLLKKLNPTQFGDKAGQGNNVRELLVRFEDEFSANPNYRASVAANQLRES